MPEIQMYCLKHWTGLLVTPLTLTCIHHMTSVSSLEYFFFNDKNKIGPIFFSIHMAAQANYHFLDIALSVLNNVALVLIF